MAMIEANEKKSDEERLSRDEFVLDIAERDRMVAEAEIEQQKLREEIEFQVSEESREKYNIAFLSMAV